MSKLVLDRVVAKLMLAAVWDAATCGYDWGQALADQKITEAKAVQRAASKFLAEPWRGWLGAGAFGAAVMKLLDSRLAGAVEWDDALAEVDDVADGSFDYYPHRIRNGVLDAEELKLEMLPDFLFVSVFNPDDVWFRCIREFSLSPFD